MKREVILILAAMILFLSGCVTQTFTQKMERDGTSVVESRTNLVQYPGYLKLINDEFKKKDVAGEIGVVIENVCKGIEETDPLTKCNVEDLSLIMKKEFTIKDGYYTFEAKEGIPYTTYVLKVNKIPVDKFSKELQAQQKTIAASQYGSGIPLKMTAIDLRKAEDASIAAQGLEQVQGAGLIYAIEMPGEIVKAESGAYNASITGNTAEFDLIDVMKNSSPLVVESQEINVLWIVIILGTIALVVVGYSFFAGQKKSV